ncbi:MAG: sll0787 family AIR synthase-like protein [Myxococcales bacterium]|nr:sll0787 family AIR synthase-like protein [Myxococcales bacterium]
MTTSQKSELILLAERLATSPGMLAKRDIAEVMESLRIGGDSAIQVGDDTAAMRDETGWQLLACEGMIGGFVQAHPWFAGWSSVMVNLSDIAAMGGRPHALVNALWARSPSHAQPILEGMRAAADAFDVPIVGGHTNLRSPDEQVSVTALGHAKALLTSFDAEPGDVLILAVDLRGKYFKDQPFWNAATEALPARLRKNLELLPRLSEAGLSCAAKDVSQGGILGTTAMFLECSRVGMVVNLDAIPRPQSVDLERWLVTFPSFGYLIAVKPQDVKAVLRLFQTEDIAAAVIGTLDNSEKLYIQRESEMALVRDLAVQPLIGCAPTRRDYA